MGVCTLVFGLLFAFTNYLSDSLAGSSRIIMAMMFIAYSIFRFVRVYQSIKYEDKEQI
jgi:hypothetical protein